MAQVSMTVVGLKEARNKLALLRKGVVANLALAAEQGANIIRNEAAALVPYRSGTLRRSITVAVTTKTFGRVEFAVGPTEPYGKYVEFGTGVYAEGGNGRTTPWRYKRGDGSWVTTRGQKAKPFMRPAFDNKQDEALAEIREVFNDLLEGP